MEENQKMKQTDFNGYKKIMLFMFMWKSYDEMRHKDKF